MEFAAKPAVFTALRMSAVWSQSEADASEEFEYRTVVEVPGVSEPFVAGSGTFIFRTKLYRIIAGIFTDMPRQSGRLIVTSSIRRVGTEDWVSQEYVIQVERIEPGANQPNLPGV
jgi:hypothetical protein